MYTRENGVTRISAQESILVDIAIIDNSIYQFINFTVIILGMQSV
jgi:hypothetical protein